MVFAFDENDLLPAYVAALNTHPGRGYAQCGCDQRAAGFVRLPIGRRGGYPDANEIAVDDDLVPATTRRDADG